MTTQQLRETTENAAQTASEEGRHLAGVAADEAKSVAADAQAQARHLLDDARSTVEEQSRTQLESLVSTLQVFADDLEKMARGEGPGSGLARDVVQEVGDRAKALSDQVRGREPSELLDQARTFARRRPGTFLLGALAAGVVAGRVARGAKDAQGSSSSTTGTTGTTGTTTAPAAAVPPPPVAPTPEATTPPGGPAGTAVGDPLSGLGTP